VSRLVVYKTKLAQCGAKLRRVTADRDALRARVAELERQLHNPCGDCATYTGAKADLRWALDEVERLRGDVKDTREYFAESIRNLRAALKRYGRHTYDDNGERCPRHWVDEDCGEDGSLCTCGLDAALGGEP
jgi:uncharacterized protein YhaN